MRHPSAERQHQPQHVDLERLPPIRYPDDSSGSELGHEARACDNNVHLADRLFGRRECAIESGFVHNVDFVSQDLRRAQGLEVFLRGAEDRPSTA